MVTVWKYELPFNAFFSLAMPKGAKVLHVEEQDEVACIWAQVDSDAATESRSFALVGTGREIPPNATHVGTFLSGVYVWHVYEPVPA